MMDDDLLKIDITDFASQLGLRPDLARDLPKLIEAISKGVVKHLKENAKANVTSGSSTGLWSIE